MSKPEQLITKHIDIWTSAILAKSTSGRGSSKKNELYGIKKLRELILELAVRGKLVPQNPEDEPASVLLEKIANEKVRLVQEKEIKKPKILSEITDDEKNFELPIGWEWARLADCYYTVGSKINQIQAKEYLEKGDFPVVDQGKALVGGYHNDKTKVISVKKPVVIFGDHTRNIKFIDFDFIIGADGVKVLCPYTQLYPRFFYQAITSYDLTSRGYARHFKVLNEKLIAIPPIAEQHRIVAKVDELMLLCDELEQQTEANIDAHAILVEVLLVTLTDSTDANDLAQNWARVCESFASLFTTEQNIEALKQTVLQLAVMGKLVPQNPEDEPASVLLEKIANEKVRLVQEKKIKKEKPLRLISDDEKPFGLPKGWEYARLNEVYPLEYGKNLPKPKRTDTGEFNVYGSNGVVGSHNESSTSSPCIVVGRKGSAGALNLCLENGCWVTDVAYSCTPPTGINLMFAFRQLQTMGLDTLGKGIKPGLNRNDAYLIVVAIPPLDEQHRIVTKVDELMKICDQLKDKLQQSQVTQIQLTDALIEKALV